MIETGLTGFLRGRGRIVVPQNGIGATQVLQRAQ